MHVAHVDQRGMETHTYREQQNGTGAVTEGKRVIPDGKSNSAFKHFHVFSPSACLLSFVKQLKSNSNQ